MAENVIADEGPWQVDIWGKAISSNAQGRVVLQSDQFEHDVALVINGDFESFEQRVAYAEALCHQLNESTKLLKEKGWTA